MGNLLDKDVIHTFNHKYHTPPAAVISAPGRINLIGEHTDYTGGFVLPTAIDRSIKLAFSPIDEPKVRVHSIDLDEIREVKLTAINHDPENWFEFIKGVAWAMKEMGHPIRGWQGVFTGDIPIGAGLSSSAALEIAVVKAFCLASDITLLPTEMALIGKKAEIDWVGVNVGIMDQLISAGGKAGHAMFLDCKTLAYDFVAIPDEVTLVVLDTMTRRELTHSAYNTRRHEVATAENILEVPSLREATLNDLIHKEPDLPQNVFKRAKHIVTENERVQLCVKLMRNGDISGMGDLINESHISLRDDFEVSSAELNTIVEISQGRPGCLGARMTGAGFGGCALAIIENEFLESFTKTVIVRYYKEKGIKPQIYPIRSSSGVHYKILS